MSHTPLYVLTIPIFNVISITAENKFRRKKSFWGEFSNNCLVCDCEVLDLCQMNSHMTVLSSCLEKTGVENSRFCPKLSNFEVLICSITELRSNFFEFLKNWKIECVWFDSGVEKQISKLSTFNARNEPSTNISLKRQINSGQKETTNSRKILWFLISKSYWKPYLND